MLLIKIAVHVLCAALSLPIFPYIIFRKRLLRPGLLPEEETETFKSTLISINKRICPLPPIFFALLLLMFYSFWDYQDGRQSWHIFVLPFIIPTIFQLVWALLVFKNELLTKVIPVLIVAFILILLFGIRYTQSAYEELRYQELRASLVESEIEETTSRIDDSIIRERYKTAEVNYKGHKDEVDIYIINGKEVGFGVLTVHAFSLTQDLSEGSVFDFLSTDLDGYSTVEYAVFNFYPCKYRNTIKGPVRDRFKSEEIVSLGIVINDKTPYAKFGILKRDGFFSKPQIDYYVFLNMVTGEIISLQEIAIP